MAKVIHDGNWIIRDTAGVSGIKDKNKDKRRHLTLAQPFMSLGDDSNRSFSHTLSDSFPGNQCLSKNNEESPTFENVHGDFQCESQEDHTNVSHEIFYTFHRHDHCCMQTDDIVLNILSQLELAREEQKK